MTPPVTTQAARDAAGEIGYQLGIRSIEQRRRMRLGERDDDRLVLAFAKAIAEENGRVGSIVDRWIAECESRRNRHGPRSPKGQMWEAHRVAAVQIATAIRATATEVGNG